MRRPLAPAVALAVALAACAEDPSAPPTAEEITACSVHSSSVVPRPDGTPDPLPLTCLPATVDLDAAAAGTQAECSVTTDDEVLAACDHPGRDPARPCFRFAPELDGNCVEDARALVVERGAEVTAARWAQVECVAACS